MRLEIMLVERRSVVGLLVNGYELDHGNLLTVVRFQQSVALLRRLRSAALQDSLQDRPGEDSLYRPAGGDQPVADVRGHVADQLAIVGTGDLRHDSHGAAHLRRGD